MNKNIIIDAKSNLLHNNLKQIIEWIDLHGFYYWWVYMKLCWTSPFVALCCQQSAEVKCHYSNTITVMTLFCLDSGSLVGGKNYRNYIFHAEMDGSNLTKSKMSNLA